MSKHQDLHREGNSTLNETSLADSINKIKLHRALNHNKSKIYKENDLASNAKRIRRCAELIGIRQNADGTKFAVNVSGCRDRGCFRCEKAKQRNEMRMFDHWFDFFMQAHPYALFLYISAGFENIPVMKIGETIKDINKGLTAVLRKGREFEVLGSLIAREFKPKDNEIVHPNIHIILAVDNDALSSAEWSNHFREKLGLETNPSLKKERVLGLRYCDIKQAVKKCLGYTLKPQDYFQSEFATEMIVQLKYKRLVTYGGAFKQFRKSVVGSGVRQRDMQTLYLRDDML